MKFLTRAAVTAGLGMMVLAPAARADAPSLAAYENGATFFATGTSITVRLLYSLAGNTNELRLFASVGGIGTFLISVPGNTPVGAGPGSDVVLGGLTAGQSLLFGLCSTDPNGSANPNCPAGMTAWYSGPAANNAGSDGLVHTAILDATTWNGLIVGIRPASVTGNLGRTIVGFEDANVNNGSDRDFNDVVFEFENVTTVPEPGTMGLLALGLVGLSGAGLARRRARKQG